MSKGITWPDAVESRHFANFPGVYGPGVVVPLKATGMTKKEARERIAAANLPLEIVELEPAKPAAKTTKGGE